MFVTMSESFGQLPRPGHRPAVLRLTVQPAGAMPSAPPPDAKILHSVEVSRARLRSTNAAMIRELARDAVQRIARLGACETLVVDISGHEDETGDPAKFGELGLLRAVNVTNSFAAAMARQLTPADMRRVEFQVSSQGPSHPIRSNVTPAGRAMNRRVEVRMEAAQRCI